jgi:NAD(P)-dependent dehydrogenase (short-subunit alcohol dehydrogenase family)
MFDSEPDHWEAWQPAAHWERPAPLPMSFDNATALVTGAASPLGQAYVRALLDAGAGKVFVDARDPVFARDARVRAIRLDVCSASDVQKAARLCGDLDVLVLNPLSALAHRRLARREMDGSVYGLMRMAEVFGPALARRRGALINVLPGADEDLNGRAHGLSALNTAARAVTEALRLELRSKGVAVVGVFGSVAEPLGLAATRRTASRSQRLALRTLDAVTAGHTSVYADDDAEEAAWSGIAETAESGDTTCQRLETCR